MVDIDAARTALREHETPSLRRRRKVAALSALGLADFALISLYQAGVLRRLPDPKGRIFDSGQVNLSSKAFALGGPDAPLGALQYAAQLVLATYGGTREAGRPRWLDAALAASGAVGAVSAVDYLRDMLLVEKRVCPYCVLGAGLNLAIAALATREAIASYGGDERPR